MIQLKRDALWHRHYVVLSGVRDGTCHWCLTPSRQVRKVNFDAAHVLDIRMYDCKRLPKGLKRAKVFLDADSTGGVYTDVGIQAKIRGI